MTFSKTIAFFTLAMMLVACAGSPAQDGGKSPQQYAYENYRDASLPEICSRTRNFSENACVDFYNEQQRPFCQMRVEAYHLEMDRRNLPQNCCADRQKCAQVAQLETEWESEIYNIDLLRVTTLSKKDVSVCTSGGIHKIVLEGTISPDSSFAIERLLKRLPSCRNNRGDVIVATTVQLKSGGGYLVDGYKLGRSLRKTGATTTVENKTGCASSCAVAFLGGKKRVVEDTGAIMFHAPYFSGKNTYGEKVIDCDIPEPDLQVLNDYYIEMVGKEAGDRLYERTMWYCSAEDGWVVTGGSAAELYDIATEK